MSVETSKPDASLSRRAPRVGGALAVLTIVWLCIAVYVSSFGAAASSSSGVFPWIAGLLLLPIVWLFYAVRSLFKRRRFGWVGWLIPPVTYALAVLPLWSSLLFPMRVRAHLTELTAFVHSHATIPETAWQNVGADVAVFSVNSVFRSNKTIILCFHRNPEGESGLIYAPDGNPPEPPEWAKVHFADPVDAAWFWYGWHPD